MPRNVGIWIDHTKAVIVFVSADRVTAKTVESDAGPHARYSGRAPYPTPGGPKAGRGEKKYEARYGQHLERYVGTLVPSHDQTRMASRLHRPAVSCSERCTDLLDTWPPAPVVMVAMGTNQHLGHCRRALELGDRRGRHGAGELQEYGKRIA